jgi:hypothetical protein
MALQEIERDLHLQRSHPVAGAGHDRQLSHLQLAAGDPLQVIEDIARRRLSWIPFGEPKKPGALTINPRYALSPLRTSMASSSASATRFLARIMATHHVSYSSLPGCSAASCG